MKTPATKEPASPGHAASYAARGVAPENKPLVIGKGEHAMSPNGSAFKVAKHGVRKAGADNPKNR
jgi:hypothetical protein